MLTLDWDRLDHKTLNATMQNIGVADYRQLSIFELLVKFDLGSNRTTEDSLVGPPLSGTQKQNLHPTIRELLEKRVLCDANGSLKLREGTNTFFLTLVGPRPKEYLRTYMDVGRILLEKHGFGFNVWLDDRLTAINMRQNPEIVHSWVDVFREYYTDIGFDCRVLVSSEAANGIPVDFASTYLSKVSGADLFGVLPYRSRYPWTTRVIDIVHFAWMCYLSKILPGIHFAGANNKRHYQIFRSKVARDSLTVLLFRLGSEKEIK